ncbi:AAA family ATPase [Halopenitus sp. H-Gu1]|uniref:AAA family ATPase n=1 Tax=Halopenitus sp. H-Gu1 TaxID=3242697 RepID=UPI00359DE55B
MSIRIDQVTLENIKSYADETTITIGPGVTAILGDNGSGKSTIQEAVGYALFDTHPFQNQDRLVRDGESSGHVEVTFTVRETEQTYTVRRWAGRSKYDVLDENGDLLGLDTGGEVKDWLCNRLNVDTADDLSNVWERSVGVPQTDFISDFTQSEADRIDTFDPLFDIERYREAYSSLSGLKDEFEGEIGELEDEITRLEERLEDLPEAKRDVANYEDRVDELQEKVESLTGEIDGLENEKDDLESLQTDLEDARQKRTRLKEDKIPAQKTTLSNAKDRREKARKAKERLEEVKDDHEQHLEAQERLGELEEKREKRDELDSRLTKLNGDIDRVRDKISRLKEDKREAVAAHDRVEELEPKKERYEALKAEIEDLHKKEGRVEEIGERLNAITEETGRLENDVEELRGEIEDAKSCREEANRLTKLREQRQDLVAKKQSLENERQKCREQNEELREIELGEASEVACPTCDQPVTAEHRESVIEENEGRIGAITDTEIPAVESEIAALDEDIESARESKEAVDQIPQLEEQLDSITTEISDLRTEREELEAERESLTDTLDALPEKKAERDELEGVVDDYHTAKAKATDVDETKATLQDARRTLGEHLLAHQRVQNDLAEFDGLDTEISDVEAIIEDTADAHETYIRKEDDAAELPECEEEVEAERKKLESLRGKRDGIEETVEDLQSEFDPDRLTMVKSNLRELRDDRSKAEGKLEDRESDLQDARDGLNDLKEKRERKQSLEAEIEEVRRDQEFARWVRNSLQQGAEDLRDLVTSEIGDRANTIYQQLRGNPTETLVWDKTYNLRVRVRGQNKPFDTLSGGEKMAAALSVRLAVLEQLASVGVAFLDEPTANLDQQKKQNLVAQLEDLDELNQLFVVSHDRTFESMTERTVELTKDEDREMTKVVSE